MEEYMQKPTTLSQQEQVSFPEPSFVPEKRPLGWSVWTMIVLIVLLLGVLISAGIGGERLGLGAMQGKAAIESAQEHALAFEFAEAGDDLALAHNAFEGARSGINWMFWMKPIPWVGDQINGVGLVLDAGIESIAALESAISIAEDVYEIVLETQALLEENNLPADVTSFSTLPPDIRGRLLSSLHNSHDRLLEMQAKLRIAQQDLADLHELNVSPALLDAVEPFEVLLPDLIAGVDFFIPLSASVDEIAGVGESRQWMMLFMNNTELRPGGGFIGVVGLLTMNNGDLENFLVQDVYDIDQAALDSEAYFVTPPSPITEYLSINEWFLRDSNWSPDFAESSETAITLLRQEVALTGQPVPEIHGVFGFTPNVAEDLLELTGPVEVDGHVFTHENVVELLEFEVEFGFVDDGIAYDDRKSIVSDLADEVLSKVYDLPVSEWGSLFDIFVKSFSNKQMALYASDDQAQAAFVDAGWSATMDTGHVDDVLMVVDANLGALKSDPKVDRHITYTVEPDGDGYRATVDIEYTHNGVFDLFTSTYRTYTRVYAPLGSELISAEGAYKHPNSFIPREVDVAEELGMTSFGTFTWVDPQKSGTLSFTYALPDDVAEAIDSGLYQLKVFKQIGADNHALTLDLDFGKTMLAAEPAEDSSEFGDDLYFLNTILDQDMVFTAELAP